MTGRPHSQQVAMPTRPDGVVTVSAIVPTIGRPESLRRLLHSLSRQSVRPYEIVVADGSGDDGTAGVVKDLCWRQAGLRVVHIRVQPPNAVRQREAAIRVANGGVLLFLDDDVELEEQCLEEMLKVLEGDATVAAVVADFSNERWSRPTLAWRAFLAVFHGRGEEQCQGKVIGPLLRFGYFAQPTCPVPMEWLGTGNTLLRKAAYEMSGGFSDFFLHRSTMNEDVDLGLKVSRIGRILFCPAARLAHFHAPSGRVSVRAAAEDDVFNRAFVMRRTVRRSALGALFQSFVFVAIETLSNVAGACRRRSTEGTWMRFAGRASGLWRVGTTWSFWTGDRSP